MQLAQSQPEAFPDLRDATEQPLDLRSSARLAADFDAFVASPVHRLQSELSAFAAAGEVPVPDRYPGWFRLGFPIAASGVLWFMILRLIGLVG